jgi:ribonuclease BN (tRNA processing enzyme)
MSRRGLLRSGGVVAATMGVVAATGTTRAEAATVRRSTRATRGYRTKVVLLGTSGGPIWWRGSTRRGTSSVVAVGDAQYIVDLGAGALGSMRDAKLLGPADGKNDLARLRAVFLTHLHSDHISDYPTLLLEGWIGGGLGAPDRALHVHGPGRRAALPDTFPAGRPTPSPVIPDNPGPGTVEMTESLFAAFATDINDRVFDSASPDIRSRIQPHDVALPDGIGPLAPEAIPRISPFPVYEDDRVKVTATLVDHGQMLPSFGYRFDTDDGSVVFSGDTTVSANLVELAQDCDVLVHEVIDKAWVIESISALPVPDEVKTAYQNHMLGAHTTIPQVAQVATDAGARTLVLHHFVPGHLPERRWERASRGFAGELVVGRDLQRIGVGRPNRR